LRSLVLAILLCACSPADEWKPSRPGEIFRYTSIGDALPSDSIILGQPWLSATKYGAANRDTLTTLPSDAFSGADAVRVHRDSSGLVTAMEFDYAASRDIDSIRKDYERTLGKPDETFADTVDGRPTRATVWRDAVTEFRLTEFGRAHGKGVAATAVLRDRRLSGSQTRS
jgi:hypothetical protein